MNLNEEELDALADRLANAPRKEAEDRGYAEPLGFIESTRAVAREAARWATEKEREGEVVWQAQAATGWYGVSAELAASLESQGAPVRAIRVIATTTKGVG